jgi:menaquinol-cytochrome c reductase iron-sulfur subunit
MDTTESGDRIASEPPVHRRDFLKKAIAVLIGGVVTTVPAVAGLLVFLNPLRKRGNGGNGASEAGFTDIAPLSALPADGMPRRFQVLAERVDAWNKHPAAPVGAVFLKRDKGTPDKVVAFNVVCPHAGCPVQPAPGGSFLCPCHNSAFHPDGSPAPGCVSPRGLDELAVDPDGITAGAIRVRFQNFQAGTHDKIPAT